MGGRGEKARREGEPQSSGLRVRDARGEFMTRDTAAALLRGEIAAILQEICIAIRETVVFIKAFLHHLHNFLSRRGEGMRKSASENERATMTSERERSKRRKSGDEGEEDAFTGNRSAKSPEIK